MRPFSYPLDNLASRDGLLKGDDELIAKGKQLPHKR